MPASRAAPAFVLLVVAAAMTLPATRRALAAPSPLPPGEQHITDGRRLYQRDCAYCHGANAQGTERGQSLEGTGPAEVDYAVSTGRMPLHNPDAPRRRRTPLYDRQQLDALLAYLGPYIAAEPSIPKVDPSKGDLAHGGELFRAQCASCHQWAGEGGGLLGRNAPSLHSATPQQLGDAVRAGPVTMPAFSEATITPADLNDIAAYVQYLRHPQDRGGLGLWHLGPVGEGLVAWAIGLAILILGINWIGERE